jgi:Replication-relaxation
VGGSIVIESKKGRRARGRSAEAKRADALAAVTEFDRQLLILLSAHRVLTQTQLERLHPDVAVRTLRYRTERLERLGLVGRSRPYREKGSAPFHLWPTRRADAFVRAEPVAAGGERPEPNPLFLAHAAALSELYVALATQAHVLGLRLRSYDREGDAREPFTTLGRKRALAPDVLLDLEDERSQRLLAFVELDLGTMSHARLKTKAAGYAGYAAEAAWTHQHPYCPCLLFLTTSDARAYRFLKALQAGLETADHERGGRAHVDWFAAGACALAHEPERALTEACWDDLTLSGGGLGLRACLEAARAPFDERRAREEAKRRAREQQLARLRADPSTLRAHLRERRCADLHHRPGRFGEDGREALYLLLDSERPLPMRNVRRSRHSPITSAMSCSSGTTRFEKRHHARTRRPRWRDWSSRSAPANSPASRRSRANTASCRACGSPAANSPAQASCSGDTAPTRSRQTCAPISTPNVSKQTGASAISLTANEKHDDAPARPASPPGCVTAANHSPPRSITNSYASANAAPS